MTADSFGPHPRKLHEVPIGSDPEQLVAQTLGHRPAYRLAVGRGVPVPGDLSEHVRPLPDNLAVTGTRGSADGSGDMITIRSAASVINSTWAGVPLPGARIRCLSQGR
jgi:hypothetical protein